MMATRTTTTRTTPVGLVPSADTPAVAAGHADFSFEALVQAYLDCRRNKRSSRNALTFELNLERNLMQLHTELNEKSYQPGQSICFVVTHPKPREVWAADFRDRIVHHLLYNHIGPRIERSFIADSCACITGRGTLYAAQRLEAKIRSITQNWSRPAHYLKCDLANFFVTIDKRVLSQQLVRRIQEPQWLALAQQILMHDPRENYLLHSPPRLVNRVPQHKRLATQPSYLGLPIGNLSSQFFANLYLDTLDQHVKHQLRARHYIRYVDDFVLLHQSPEQLSTWLKELSAFLPERLGVRLNPSKTIHQPVCRGVDFVGQVIKPWHRTTRRRTVLHALKRIETTPANDLTETANSYFGLLTQATHSHTDRRKLAKAVLLRGKTVNTLLTKTYKGAR
ncbi:RNA-directed DNA polymerase [Pseudomonas extremaustralis]|uniref:RNA-directed DNA polymerase n=1 Tax=Pseudomonas extremaustralis TaxID=359110 RepID=UPI00286A72CC|nr:RNA-directed DNA polymerase [Pseudomonas extremaustralis]